MPQSCTVCRHEKRDEIDRELLDGKPFRHIAERFGTSASALVRHKANDIPVALSKAHEVAATNYGDDLFSHVKDLNRRTLAILRQAEISGDPRTALAAIREDFKTTLRYSHLSQEHKKAAVEALANALTAGPEKAAEAS